MPDPEFPLDDLPQRRYDARLLARCRADERVRAVLRYGSFTQGEGDRWSDIEYWIFVTVDAHPAFDVPELAAAVAPPLALIDHGLEAGFTAWTAIFPDLVRCELHAAPVDALAGISDWPLMESAFDADAMVALDRDGALRAALTAGRRDPALRAAPERRRALADRFVDGVLFGLNLLARGEFARAHDILWGNRRLLLQLARSDAGLYRQHYLTPSKRLEWDLPQDDYARYVAATSAAEPGALRRAYRAAWHWFRELEARIPHTPEAPPRDALLDAVEARLRSDPGEP